jgi:hypothetical protein
MPYNAYTQTLEKTETRTYAAWPHQLWSDIQQRNTNLPSLRCTKAAYHLGRQGARWQVQQRERSLSTRMEN